MTGRRRRLVAGFVILLGTPLVLFFGGGAVAMCLGPLNVTEVECATRTGLFSSVGMGAPGVALVAAATLLILVPIRARDRLFAVAGAGTGALTGGVLFLAVWPKTLDGLDSRGQWLSVPRPLDAWALVTSIIVGAALGFAMVAALVIRPATRGRPGG